MDDLRMFTLNGCFYQGGARILSFVILLFGRRKKEISLVLAIIIQYPYVLSLNSYWLFSHSVSQVLAGFAQAFVDRLCADWAGVKPCVSFGQQNSIVYATVPATSTQGVISDEDKAKQAVGGIQLVRFSFPPTMDMSEWEKQIDRTAAAAYAKPAAASTSAQSSALQQQVKSLMQTNTQLQETLKESEDASSQRVLALEQQLKTLAAEKEKVQDACNHLKEMCRKEHRKYWLFALIGSVAGAAFFHFFKK